MSIRVGAGESIILEGVCPSEDAEILLQHLIATPSASVDLRHCEAAHTAVIQVLMAVKPRLLGPPLGDLMRNWIYPLLGTVSN